MHYAAAVSPVSARAFRGRNRHRRAAHPPTYRCARLTAANSRPQKRSSPPSTGDPNPSQNDFGRCDGGSPLMHRPRDAQLAAEAKALALRGGQEWRLLPLRE
jgi:hypothetical protein